MPKDQENPQPKPLSEGKTELDRRETVKRIIKKNNLKREWSKSADAAEKQNRKT